MPVILDSHAPRFHVIVLESKRLPVLSDNVRSLDVNGGLSAAIARAHETSPITRT